MYKNLRGVYEQEKIVVLTIRPSNNTQISGVNDSAIQCYTENSVVLTIDIQLLTETYKGVNDTEKNL